MFRIEVLGNIGADAEIKSDNGRRYVQFSVADTRKFRREDGTEQEVTNWFSCFMRNADSEVIKYLRRGVKVFVRGNGDLRVFSSAKDRMMKAGASINVTEIELAGGTTDDVPRDLVLPNGQLFKVQKYYHVDVDAVTPRPTELFGRDGSVFQVDNQGWVMRYEPPQQEQPQQQQQTDNPTIF